MLETATMGARLAATGNTAAGYGPPSANDYSVVRGDTFSGIAARFGVSVDALEAANPQIANPSLIFPGERLSIPVAAGVHMVERGETFGAIAREAGVSVGQLKAANPQVLDIDRIYPGEHIALPSASAQPAAAPQTAAAAATARPQAAAPVSAASGLENGVLHLSAQDVTDIKKTLQTEWVQSAGEEQAKGIVDTVLNRQASGHWGESVSDVVNARNQFSDINGPVSRRAGRSSVDQFPASRISTRVDAFVDGYLADRAAGTASRVEDHLNYANPNFSDARNLPWIMALNGPVLGGGNAIHRHGTTPDLQTHRPGAFEIALP